MTKSNSGILVPLLLCCAVAFAQERNSCAKGFHTLYSREAVTLDPAFDHPVHLVSPDGKKTLVVRTFWDKNDPDGAHISYKVLAGGKNLEQICLASTVRLRGRRIPKPLR